MTIRDQRSVSGRLGLRPGLRVWFGGHDRPAKRAVAPFLAEATRPPTGPIDTAFIAAETPEEADYFLRKLARRLPPGATVWMITRVSDQHTEDPHTGHETVTLDSDYAARPVRCG